MVKISVNRPGVSDIPEIHDLFDISVKDIFAREGIDKSHTDDIIDEITGLRQTLQRDFDSEGHDEHFLVAEISDRIVGTVACGSPNRLITSHLKTDLTMALAIKCMYVHPKYQGQRVGKSLFTSILKIVKDRGFHAFCLDCGYTISQKFWIHLIGHPTVILTDYWDENAHHMIWHRLVASTPLRR